MSIFHLTRRTFLVSTALASADFLAYGQKQKIQVGCQANGFPQREGDFGHLLDIIQSMKTMDYAGFECNVIFLRDQFAHAREARKKLHDTGMQFIGAHTAMPSKEDDGEFSKLADNVAQLGATNIVLSGAGRPHDGRISPEAVHAKSGQLNALAKICHESGIGLSYHNHTEEFANSNEEIQALADNTDADLVRFLVDAGHAYQGGGDPAVFMLKNSRRIVGCHIKTFRNKIEQVPLGRGDFSFEDLAKAIRKTAWTGWLIDEEGNQKGGDTAAVEPDRHYIRKVFGV